ncbi:hypothetical protein ACFLUU_04010 [Chloroflexota bacterium]
MAKLDISSYDVAIGTLIKLRLIPYWDSTAKRVFFRGAGRQQRNKDWVDALIEALQLYSEEDGARVKEDIKKRVR